MLKMMRGLTRSALVFSAAQWAWHNRDDIKRELEPVLARGRQLVAEVQSRRAGTTPVTERPATTAVIVRTPAAAQPMAS
jgi:predicted secreted protein